jgi:hypothetical protein
MTRSWRMGVGLASAMLAIVCMQGALIAAPFTASYGDGSTWNTIYAQGFNAFVNDGMTEPLNFGDPVPLSRFEFFKSGNVDTAANIKLAIITPFFANIQGLTTSTEGTFIGLSTNTIASTASIATGEPIRFDFDDLQLTFGDYYGAVMVNVDEAGNITPVLVSALTADYIESPAGSGTFVPETNYDFTPENPTDYNTSVSNFITVNEFGHYFFGFGGAGDANFTAYFDHDFPDSAPGDFDGDDDVDGRDFLIWQRGLSTGGPLSPTDLSDWQTHYGTSGLAALAAVPEPASVALVAAAGTALLLCRRGM